VVAKRADVHGDGSPASPLAPSPFGKTPSTFKREAAPAPTAKTAFCRALAATTASAPERVAAKLIERLQHECMEEAGLGHCSLVWDASLPGGRRFSDAAARAFAGKLQELGFHRVEWWSGKEWKEMPGRYLITHDTMYDKFNVRIRVMWPESSSEEAVSNSKVLSYVRPPSGMQDVESSLAPVVEQLQQVLAMQQKLLQQALDAQAAADRRAARAEERMLEVERRIVKAAETMPETAASPFFATPKSAAEEAAAGETNAATPKAAAGETKAATPKAAAGEGEPKAAAGEASPPRAGGAGEKDEKSPGSAERSVEGEGMPAPAEEEADSPQVPTSLSPKDRQLSSV